MEAELLPETRKIPLYFNKNNLELGKVQGTLSWWRVIPKVDPEDKMSLSHMQLCLSLEGLFFCFSHN